MADTSTANQHIPVYKKTDALYDEISGEFTNKKSQLYEFKYDENNSAEKKINKRKYKRKAKNNVARRIKIGISTNTNKKNPDKKNGANAKVFPKKVIVPSVDFKCETAPKKENPGSSNDAEPFCDGKIPASVVKNMSKRVTRSMKEIVNAPSVTTCSTPIASLAGNSKRKTASNVKNSVCSNGAKIRSDSKIPASIIKTTSGRAIGYVEKIEHVPVIASCSTPTTDDLDGNSKYGTVSSGRKFLCSNNVELSFDSFEELLPAPEEFPPIMNDVNVPVAADSFIPSRTDLKENSDHSVSKPDNKTEDYCTYFGFECESNLDRVPRHNVKENPARIPGRAVKKKVTFKTPSPVAKMTIEEIQALLRGKSPSRDLLSVDSIERDTTICSDDSAVEYMNNSSTTTVNDGILRDITNQELLLDSQSLTEKSTETSCCIIRRQKQATKYLQENNFPPSSADDDIAAEKKKKRIVYKKNKKVVEDKKFEDKFKLMAESLNSKFREIEDFELAVE